MREASLTKPGLDNVLANMPGKVKWSFLEPSMESSVAVADVGSDSRRDPNQYVRRGVPTLG